MNDPIVQLQSWYAAHCDGEWEHTHAVRIESIDNPGWWVQVDLAGTELESATFGEIASNVDPEGFANADDWYNCKRDGTTWHGAGDPSKLTHILQVFLTWAAANQKEGKR